MLRKPSKQFLLLGLLLVLAASLIGAIIYSEITARKYIAELQSSANSVRSAVKILENGVDSPLLYDPGAASSTRSTDAKKQKDIVAQCRTKIADFSVKSGALPSLSYAEHVGTFAIASTLKERSHHVVSQTNDTLDRYNETIAFLEVYATSLEKTTKIMAEFNTISNFNEYTGRSGYFRQMAVDIQAEADTLNTTQTPPELVAIKEANIKTLKQLATQLNNLAYGMDVAIDDLIYGSVREIEATNTQLNTHVEKTYSETVSKLRVIQDIYDLNEKLDLILP